jgi:arylsulfatase
MTSTARSLFAVAIALTAAGCTAPNDEPAIDERPNILLIVADDLGFADIGVHGSAIQTPNIDRLAREGILFTQFHTAPMCAPTRAMLLSGNNNHVAGMAKQGRPGLAGNDVPGYETTLSDRIVPFPKLLRDSGYHTYSVGKWHLGEDREHGPVAAGFEHAFNLLQAAGSHFDSSGYTPDESLYREDQELVAWPEGAYSTDLYTEKLIGFIERGRGDGKPFFAYAAYTSPHWPLQVPDEYLDRYKGKYDQGYDVQREKNFAALQSSGIIPADLELRPRNDAVTPWQDLSDEDQRREAREMELYAAMVDNLDDHVGRLLDYLRDTGLYQHTLIVFMSDNGAAAEDLYNSGRFKDYLQETFDNSYESMGRKGSFVSYGQPWAEASSAPFLRHKTYTTEGGLRAPLIIAGAGVAAADAMQSAYVAVTDLAPTFLELAGAHYPDDGSVAPLVGASLQPLLSGAVAEVHDDQYVTTLSHWGRAFLRQGRWKLVTLEPPFDEANFELFDLDADPAETRNLAETEPDRYAQLIELWRAERKRFGIILPEDL